MSYNSLGTFNNTLTPATSNQYEIGVKTLLFGSTLINASTYKINTANEISIKSQSGGQSVYQASEKDLSFHLIVIWQKI